MSGRDWDDLPRRILTVLCVRPIVTSFCAATVFRGLAMLPSFLPDLLFYEMQHIARPALDEEV